MFDARIAPFTRNQHRVLTAGSMRKRKIVGWTGLPLGATVHDEREVPRVVVAIVRKHAASAPTFPGLMDSSYTSHVNRELLVERLSKMPNLVAAYLFGSRARGDATDNSDLDIAVWLDQRPTSLQSYPFELPGELEQALGVRVDLVVLNGAPSDLVHRVLRDGELLIQRDPGARIRFEVRSRNDYFDMQRLRNAYRGRPPGAQP